MIVFVAVDNDDDDDDDGCGYFGVGVGDGAKYDPRLIIQWGRIICKNCFFRIDILYSKFSTIFLVTQFPALGWMW